MMVRLFLSGVVVCLAMLTGSAFAQEPELKGNIITVGAGDDVLPATAPAEVNVGGLFVVKIHDQGSAGVEDIKVTADKGLKHLGNLGGVGVSDGHLLMGGGYTVILLKAESEAKAAKIKVTYKTAEHVGGNEETEEYKVDIVPYEEGEDE